MLRIWNLVKASVLLVLFAAATATSETAMRRSPEEEAREYLNRLSPEERARSDAYFEGGYWLQVLDFGYGLGVALVLLATGLSRRVRDFSQRVTRVRPLATAIYAAFYILASAVLSFPLLVYEGFFREHRYGLSNQAFGPWLQERIIALAVVLVVFGLQLVLLYAVFRRAPRTWWIWGSIVSLSALALMILIAPVFIMPLFNDYRPLADPELKESILAVARANGVPADEVYEFDASRQSKRISANVTGILGTMRISLNDKLLSRCTPPEIHSVMGHEMGHYVLNHAYEGLMVFGLVLLLGFALLRWGFGAAQRRWAAAWGIGDIDDEAGLPLLAAVLSV